MFKQFFVFLGLLSLCVAGYIGYEYFSPLQKAKNLNTQVLEYLKQGKYEEGIPLAQQALEIRERLLGEKHPYVATSLNNLAKLYHTLGEYAKAEPLFQRSFAIEEKFFGKDHPEVATSLSNLALFYYNLGEYAKAEPLLQRSLAIEEKSLGKDHPEVATSLSNLALLYHNLGDYTKAEPLYQRSLAISEKALGKDHPDVAESLNNLATLYDNLGDYAKAEPLLQRSLAIKEKALGKDHPDVASSLNNLASLYKELGDYAKAEPLYQRSLAILEKFFGKDHPDVAASLYGLGLLYKDIGDYAKAEPLYQRSLAINEKILGRDHLTVALILNELAIIYYKLGNYAKAEPLYQRSLVIREKALGKDHPDVAQSLNNLAVLYKELGDYAKAKPLYQRSLAIREKTLGKDHPDVAQSLNNLAVLYKELGDYAKAEALYQRSLAIREKALGKDHPDVATILNNLAGLYWNLGDYAKAEPLYQRSLAIREKALGKDHPDVATILNNLALLYEKLGEYTKAEPLHQRSLAIKEKSLGKDHPDVATILNNLALLYWNLGDYAKAEPLYQRSLAIREKALGKDYPEVALSLHNLAVLYWNLGDYAKAEPLLQRALKIVVHSKQPELLWNVQDGLSSLLAKQNHPITAIFFGKQAVNTLQGLRANISQMDKSLQQSFIDKKDVKDVYQDLADLLISQGRLAEAQQVLNMMKEKEYTDFIRGNPEPSVQANFNPVEQPWAERYQAISNQLVALSQELDALEQKAKLGLTEAEEARREELGKDLDIASEQFHTYLGELIAAFDQASPERNKDIGKKNLENLTIIQEKLEELGEGTVLIHYLITEERLHILLTTPTIQLVRSVTLKETELNRTIFDFRQTVMQRKSDKYIKPAKQLYQWLIQPIADDLAQAQAKTLMLSLDGVLRYIPIAALVDDNQYLIERYALVMYTEAASVNLTTKPSSEWTMAGLGLSQEIKGFNPLPNAEIELNVLIRQKKDDPEDRGMLEGIILLNEAFNANSFRDTVKLEKYPVIHIASHFEFNPGIARNSYLLLGDGNKLTLEEVENKYQFKKLDLLTLSACETAVGTSAKLNEKADGQEVEGFGVLAQKKGAKSVIATLWSVNDESTGAFMQYFYHLRIAKQLSKVEALRQAQIAFVKVGVKENLPDLPELVTDYRHPFYWAPFILMGNWL